MTRFKQKMKPCQALVHIVHSTDTLRRGANSNRRNKPYQTMVVLCRKNDIHHWPSVSRNDNACGGSSQSSSSGGGKKASLFQVAGQQESRPRWVRKLSKKKKLTSTIRWQRRDKGDLRGLSLRLHCSTAITELGPPVVAGGN